MTEKYSNNALTIASNYLPTNTNSWEREKIATISLFHHKTPHCLHASLFVTLIAGYNLEYVRHVLHQLNFHIRLILCFSYTLHGKDGNVISTVKKLTMVLKHWNQTYTSV
jgi:hypothetical protein